DAVLILCFFSSRRRHTRLVSDWSSDVCSSDLNVHGTETVLRHASRGSKRVIIVSTSEVYGKSASLPFREDADLVLGSPTKTRWRSEERRVGKEGEGRGGVEA